MRITREYRRERPFPIARDEGQEGEDTAFVTVVRPHDEAHVLDTHHHGEGPEHQGNYTENVVLVDLYGVDSVEALLDGVKGTGADVSVDNPKGAEGQNQDSTSTRGEGAFSTRSGNGPVPDLRQPGLLHARPFRSLEIPGGSASHFGRFSPSTPARLADGLGPKRLPFA